MYLSVARYRRLNNGSKLTGCSNWRLRSRRDNRPGYSFCVTLLAISFKQCYERLFFPFVENRFCRNRVRVRVFRERHEERLIAHKLKSSPALFKLETGETEVKERSINSRNAEFPKRLVKVAIIDLTKEKPAVRSFSRSEEHT